MLQHLADRYPGPSWVRRPKTRRLRVYAFDPSASVTLETAVVNDAVIELPWETPWEDHVVLGPVNEYLEVIDFDPACGLFYAPLDLNDPYLLAQDGLPPAEGCPQFHQQMVFAVVMKTIHAFERALGRGVLWAGPPHPERGDPSYTKRLRIYPHALREANAYYSPDKTALLFGYFRPDSKDGQPTEWVFTCLSQDIVAHETTHAILHGLQPRTIDAANPDMLAFHEGFADIIALFQHFSMTAVLEHQIARSAGSLRVNNLLTGLAVQFGKATGRNGALRYALDMIAQEAKAAEAARQSGAAPAPRVAKLGDTPEAHARGQFLVAAVFDAFVTIYESRTADLFRLARFSATSGEAISSDLVRRLAREASKVAEQMMRICVRALDYLPPVDFSFGEYLRALITADTDLVPVDPLRYRVAIAEAFHNRGIPVPGCISYAPESLMWDEPDIDNIPAFAGAESVNGLFAEVLGKLELGINFSVRDAPARGAAAHNAPVGGGAAQRGPAGSYQSSEPTDIAQRNLRAEAMRIIPDNQFKLWRWLEEPSKPHKDQTAEQIDAAWEELLGIRMNAESSMGSIPPSREMLRRRKLVPAISVTSARIARRQGPDGQELHQLIVQVVQRRFGLLDEKEQHSWDSRPISKERPGTEDFFWFRGGATLIVDLRDGRLRRVIRKRIDDNKRLARHRAFVLGDPVGMAMVKAGGDVGPAEPFAMVHRT